MSWRDRAEQLREALEERTGVTVQPVERVEVLEEAYVERGQLRRHLDLLAYTALDYTGGNPQELKAEERRTIVQRARVAWMKDPQAGAAVEMMNDFVFGRGIPKPQANDPQVQKVIDDFWADPDNELVLTSFNAQLALGTDLSLQSNVFVLVFDDGEDGRVKLGLLEHDAVERAVRDHKANRLRALYYMARYYEQDWDYENDSAVVDIARKGLPEVRYYEHWRHVEEAVKDAENGLRTKPKMPPDEKIGAGKVYHLALNRTQEMIFGHPLFDRTLRWFNAYNRFMDARVDQMIAAAQYIMKRKVQGTPNQLEKLATQALSRRGTLGAAVPDLPDGTQLPARSASILNENEGVTHEDFKIDTGASNAEADGRMLGGQISAGHHFPRAYFTGDVTGGLAGQTSLELPVLKAVEARQELVSGLVTFATDRAIERAVDKGLIPAELTPEEIAEKRKDEGVAPTDPAERPEGQVEPNPPLQIAAAHEEKAEDEEATQRDLGYEFSMPNPLRRMLADVVTAVTTVARTFDPSNTNVELSRVLLRITLEELDAEDAAGIVERVFPEGYVDPAQQAALAGAPPVDGSKPPSPFGEFEPGHTGEDGRRHQAGNPYGAPMQTTRPEQMRQAAWLGRDGQPVVVQLEERRYQDLPEPLLERHARRMRAVEESFERDVLAKAGLGSNGSGHNTHGGN